MKSKNTFLLAVYFLLGIIYIGACHFSLENMMLATKPLLLIILAVWFFLKTRNNASTFRNLILGAFIFSCAGDTLLMFVESKGEHFFLLGLGSFLITHLLYFFAFTKIQKSKKGLLQKKKWLVTPFILFLIFFNWYLLPDVAEAMRIPILVYSTVIVSMVLAALNLGGKIPSAIFQTIFAGALLFMFSDMLIALNKFKTPLPLSYVWIMSTYLVGQFLIAWGSAKIEEGFQS